MEHWALEHNLGHISVWIVVRNNYLKPASTIKYNVQFSQESISELAVSFNESIPKHSFLIRPLSYEQHPVPEERGVGRGNAVNAGELLLEQQIVLRHQGVLQEVGAVAVLTLHTLHYSTAAVSPGTNLVCGCLLVYHLGCQLELGVHVGDGGEQLGHGVLGAGAGGGGQQAGDGVGHGGYWVTGSCCRWSETGEQYQAQDKSLMLDSRSVNTSCCVSFFLFFLSILYGFKL